MAVFSVDTVSKQRRSENMRRIKDKNTIPELLVRSYLHRRGLRYRLHVASLPGKPDLVFPSRRVCVFVHGCFWHGCHKCVDGTRQVKSNKAYWQAKIARNKARDERNIAFLKVSGWNVFTVWECEVEGQRALQTLTRKISAARQRSL